MKKVFSVFLVMLFCVLVVAPVLAEENTKADFGFQLSGGKDRSGTTSWMGEFYLAQDWRFGAKGLAHNFAFLAQLSGMAYVYDTKHPWDNGEYGASAGFGPEYYFSDSAKMGAYVFVDILGKNRFYFAHIRPTALISLRMLKLTGGAAFHITKPVIVSETISDPIFWYNKEKGYGYDIITQRLIAETIDYFFLKGEFVLPNIIKWIDLKVTGEYNRGINQYKNIKRTELGLDVGLFHGLITLGIQYFKTEAQNVWSRWFDQNGARYTIGLNPFAAAKSFADLVQRKFVDVFWPVVVTKNENMVASTKVSDALEYSLMVAQKAYCLNETVEAVGEVKSGTPPFDVHFDFGDGNVIDFQTSGTRFPVYHSYAKTGDYCINSSVTDQWGHKVSQCACINVNDCTKYVHLRVEWCEGVDGTPKQGSSTYKAEDNEKVSYSYSLKDGYKYIIVTVDGIAVPESGSILMNKSHVLKVCATKDCPPAKIIKFETVGGIYIIKKGESATIIGQTENATSSILNGGVFVDKSEPESFTETVTPDVTTTYTLKVSSCGTESTAQITIVVDDCQQIIVGDGALVVPPSAKIGVPFTISWDMSKAQNAETILIQDPDGNDVSTTPTGSKEFTINTAGTYNFSAHVKNKCSSEHIYKPVVVGCDNIVVQEGAATITPNPATTGQEVTLNWDQALATNATATEVYDWNSSLVSTDPQGPLHYTFSAPGTYKFTIKFKSNCDEKIVEVSVVITQACVMCDEAHGVTFHSDGSFTLDKNNFPEYQNINFDFQVYNKSDCAFSVPLKYNVRYQDYGQEVLASGSQNIGTIPAHTVWNMKFNYNWYTHVVTFTFVSSSPFPAGMEPISQTYNRKVKVKLAIGDCGGL